MYYEKKYKEALERTRDNPCKDCINQKGCINCENENLKETLNNGSNR